MNHFSFKAAGWLVTAGLLAGCSSDPGVADALTEGAGGAAMSTSGGSSDTGGGSDAGGSDAGGSDAGDSDTGASDAGGSDAGGSDAGGAPGTGGGQSAGVCGDGNVDAGELCDDANDVDDDGCTACQPDGTSCADAIPVDLALGSVTVSGNTDGGGMSSYFHSGFGHEFRCWDNSGFDAPDRVFAVVPAEDGFLSFNLDSQETKMTVQVRTQCSGGQGSSMCGREGATAVRAGETYYVIVDAENEELIPDFAYQMHSGPFDLEITLSKGTCASPIPVPLDHDSWFWFTGATENGENNGYLPECNAEVDHAGAFTEEIVFALEPSVTAKMSGKLISPGFHVVGSLRSQCTDETTSQMCLANWPNENSSMTYNNFQLTAGQDMFLHVEARDLDDGGPFSMHITLY